MEPEKEIDNAFVMVLRAALSVYVPEEENGAAEVEGLPKGLARTMFRICGETNACIGMLYDCIAGEGEVSLSFLLRLHDKLHIGLQDGRNVLEEYRHMEERASVLGMEKAEFNRRYMEVQEFWKQEENGFFNGYWWQDDEKLMCAYQALTAEAELTGGINVFEEGIRHNEENPSNKIYAIQAMFNATRSGYFDEALLTQLENVMANRGNGRDIHEMNLTLDKEALQTGREEHEGIIGKETGDWLERNPAFRDMWEEMAFAIALTASEKAKQEKAEKPGKEKMQQEQAAEEPVTEEKIPEQKITETKIPENTLKETAGEGTVQSRSVIEGNSEVYRELDEVEKFYDDIFEQQRTVCQEYENYLDELRELQTESDIMFESGLNSVDDIFTTGKKAFDNFDINNAYVKPKHLSTTGGNGQKFIGASKAEAESILKDALSNGKIVSISDNGLTKAGNASYEIIIDAGKTVGTKGENLVKIVISSDGGMLSAYPIK